MIVGQEARISKQSDIAAAESSLRSIKWTGVISCAGTGPGGRPSAGTLVGARQHIGVSESDALVDTKWQHRFSWKKIGAVCRGEYT